MPTNVFEVQPGQLVYIGAIEVAATEQVQQGAVQTKKWLMVDDFTVHSEFDEKRKDFVNAFGIDIGSCVVRLIEVESHVERTDVDVGATNSVE